MCFEHQRYTVESVTAGHPDKVCDQISDAILDECLRQDPYSRVAVEVLGSHGLVVVGGEITGQVKVDFTNIVNQVYGQIGYQKKLEIITRVTPQSPDIAMGVNTGGASDQGIMYGYATKETPEFLPKGVVLAHALASGLEKLRREHRVDWLKPDGKTQVTIDNGNILTILISAQHDRSVTQEIIRKTLSEELIKPIVGELADIQILINPTGLFIQGGFEADTGLTGRKIMVDTYGGLVPHGGGCFSGKDPTKVDRSAAYMCRFVAKNLVAAGFAQKCLVSVAYAIGLDVPLMIEAYDEANHSLTELVKKHFDFRPLAIIERLNLRQPIYQATAAYGHFGKPDLPWEKIIKL